MKEFFEFVYDNPLNEDGSPKKNNSLGVFEHVYGEMYDAFEYKIILKNQLNEFCILHGTEVIGLGVRQKISLLKDDEMVKAYIFLRGLSEN